MLQTLQSFEFKPCHCTILTLQVWKEARNTTLLQKTWFVTPAWNCFSQFSANLSTHWSEILLTIKTSDGNNLLLDVPKKVASSKRYDFFFLLGTPVKSQVHLNDCTHKILAHLNFPLALKILHCVRVRSPRNLQSVLEDSAQRRMNLRCYFWQNVYLNLHFCWEI